MEEIIRFLTEYTEMFEKMEQKQVEKLGLLMTKELDKIEESIMMQQAMDKQLQNMEQRRQELFGRMGLTGKTLQEVAESCGGEERKQLTDLYRRLDGAIGNIRFYNEKAESLAKSELEKMGLDARMVGNPTGIYGETVGPKGQRFEKKV